MRVAFFGTSEFAVPALRTLARSGHTVGPVVTSPPLPSGRGRKLVPSPTELEARALGIKVLAPRNPSDPAFVSALQSAAPDAAVLAAYGYILKPTALSVPRLGFLNIHPSLLPKYRGAAPIQRALLAGETESGVTIISLSEQVDAGDIVEQEVVTVGPNETAGELSRKLADVGARLILQSLTQLEKGKARRTPQDPRLATRAAKIAKAERSIDWRDSAQQIHNRIRALSPEPGAVTIFRHRRILLLHSQVSLVSVHSEPGRILFDHPGLVVAAGAGALEITELKPEGRRTQTGQDFRNGLRPVAGEKFAA